MLDFLIYFDETVPEVDPGGRVGSGNHGGNFLLESHSSNIFPLGLRGPASLLAGLYYLVEEPFYTDYLCNLAMDEFFQGFFPFTGVCEAGVKFPFEELPVIVPEGRGVLVQFVEGCVLPMGSVPLNELEGEEDPLLGVHGIQGKIVFTVVKEPLGFPGVACVLFWEGHFDPGRPLPPVVLLWGGWGRWPGGPG
jgi:hypothetical protein